MSSYRFVHVCTRWRGSRVAAEVVDAGWCAGGQGALGTRVEQAGVFHRQHREGAALGVLLHVPRTPFRADSVRVAPQPSRKRYLRIAILFTNYLWEARRSDAFTA